MSVIRNLSISKKLLLLVLIPGLAVVFLGSQRIMVGSSVQSEMKSISDLASVLVRMSEFVHESQKERGRTAGFLASNGQAVKSELAAQRAEVDASLDSFRKRLTTFDASAYDEAFQAQLTKAMKRLDDLDYIRRRIDDLGISGPEALGYYTENHKQLLNCVSYLSKLTKEAEIANIANAYYNFLQSKERAGIERAVLNGAFTKGEFQGKTFQKFNRLVTEQDTYLASFLAAATEDDREFFTKTMKGDAVKTTGQMRAVAFASKGGKVEGVDPNTWFAEQTEKIGLLKEVEDRLSQGILALSEELGDEATTALTTASVQLIVALVVSILLVISIVRSITGPLSEAVAVAESIAEGDLTKDIEAKSTDELGRLLQAMEKMAENLRQVATQIVNASSCVAHGSEQLNNVAEQIAEASTENAASVEEVSSSMEEMAASISQNADNAHQTEKIAVDVSDNAKSGGDAVNKTSVAMKDIAGQISIVEELARQTNLLALNAAIEAARAGEHGKGFAVVAAEVRKLAERSQKSAGEISELSASSVDVAESAGEMLNRMLPEIKKTADLVQEISASSSEQDSGARQVNSAIQQLDGVIQQNASSSQELAATSAELNGQARALMDAVGFFRLGDEGRSPATTSKTSRASESMSGAKAESEPELAPVHDSSDVSGIGLDLSEDGADDEFERF